MRNKYTNKLINACKRGNLNKIKEIVKNNLVDLNQVDSLGYPPIYYAVLWGHLDIVSYLISQNVNLNIPIPKLAPDIIDHTLLENCLINPRKSWQEKLEMAKLLIDNGYNKYHSIENGTEHILDIAIMFAQNSDNFELLKFLFKNFETANMIIQVLDKPIPLDLAKGINNIVNEMNSSHSSLASVYNVTPSIPKLSDKLVEALNEMIVENELENIPVMILRLGAKINTLDNLIEIILDKCDDYNYFPKRRYAAMKNTTDLKIGILLNIQKKLANLLSTDTDIQLIAYDNQVLKSIHNKLIQVNQLSGMLINEQMDDVPLTSPWKNGFFIPKNKMLTVDDELHLHLLTNDPTKAYSYENIKEQLKSHPLQISNSHNSNTPNNDWNKKNAVLYTTGAVLLPILAYSIHKSFNFVKKLLHKKSSKDKLIHAIQHDMNNVANKLVNKMPTNTINKCDKYGYTLLDYAFSKNNLNFMKTLIKKGANTSILDSRGKNLLMQSIEKKSAPLAMYFIDNVDLSHKDIWGKDSLIYAIENNMPNVAHTILDKLIEQNLNLLTVDSSGKNTIVYAIQYNMNTIANILLDNLPYNINECDKYGYTLLNYAFSKNNLDFIKTLVSRGADTSIVDCDKKNLLMQSIEKKSCSLSLYFIDKVDVSQKDAFGKNPLIYAIENNLPNVAHTILSKLINQGSNLFIRDSSGKNALMYAVQCHANDVANTLLNHLSPNVINEPDNEGYTPFDYACVTGNKEIIVDLLKKGFKINNNSLGKNAFDRLVKKSLLSLDAFDRDFLDIVSKKYFSIVEDIIKNTNSKNIFMYCCKNNLHSIANILLTKGNIAIDAKDNNNETALSYAIKNNNTKIAKYLLQHGAKIDITDKNKKTLLMFAIENKNIALVNDLLLRGSNVFAKDKYRKSVLDYATASNKKIRDIIQAAISSNKNTTVSKHKTSKTTLKQISKEVPTNKTLETTHYITDNLLINASQTNDLSVVAKLLNPSNVDTCDESGKTCLMYACENGSLEVVDYLIKNNASLNKMDQKDKSALYYACKNNHIAVVKKLLENSIYLGFEKPDFGFSIACQKGYLDIVKLLIENRIPIDPVCNVKSPLMFACENGQLDVVKYLVYYGANVNLVLDRNGYTVMDFAKKSKNTAVINYIQNKCTKKQKKNPIPKEKILSKSNPIHAKTKNT